MIEIPVSWGELIDKVTILQIKAERVVEPSKKANVQRELDLLIARCREIAVTPDIARLVTSLAAVNLDLWRIEDEIREHERAGDFGESFVGLARSVYRTNDRRAELKRALNERLGSAIVEEKAYAAY